jgi:outer membrane protein insertion porin family
VGLAKRLTVPDDFFCIITICSYQHYDLNNYNTVIYILEMELQRNLAYTIGLSRVTRGEPIFPTYGSEFSISAKLTYFF